MFIKSFDNIKIYYKKIETTRLKNKKVIIFLHGGFQGNNTLLKKLYSFFYKQYIIIAPDLRGRGDSDFPKNIENHSLNEYSKDLYEILKKESIKEVYLIGTSFGGLVSLQFAIDYQKEINIKKIVLISSNYNLKKLRKRTRLFGIFYLTLGNFLYYFSNKGKIKKKKYIDYSDIKKPFYNIKYGIKTTLNNSIKTQLLRYQLMRKAMKFYINNDDLKKINCPVLLIYGKKDFFFNKKTQLEILKNIKKCQIKIFNKYGHNIYIENPKELSKFIKAFINKN